MAEIKTTESDKLFEALNRISQKPPITRIKPSQIEQIVDQEEKREWKENFEAVNYLYVYPLEKALKYFSIKNGEPFYRLNYENMSLAERMISLEKTLIHMGYTNDQVKKLVPQSEEESDLLLKAREKGFSDELPCYNEARIQAATNFLQTIENTEEQSRKNCA